MERIGTIKDRDRGISHRLEMCDRVHMPHIKSIFVNSQAEGVYEIGKAIHVSVVEKEKHLALCGMYIPEHLRGQNMAQILLEVAFRVGEAIQRPLNQTVKIKKPLLALILERYGFRARVLSTLAEILPKDGSVTPKVRINTEKQSIEPGYSSWFERVDGDVDLQSSNPKVGLYTEYLLTNPDQCNLQRERVQIAHNSLIRIFPNRVRKVIS